MATIKPRGLVLCFRGTNCHEETAHALELAGAKARVITNQQLEQSPKSLWETDLIVLPGGFSYGDHFGSGRVAAMELCLRFRDQLLTALERKIPILGICNGFQTLAAMGLLPGGGEGELGNPSMVLDFNTSGKFEHRHEVELVLHEPVPCVWTTGLEGKVIRVPVGHGEGRPWSASGQFLVSASYISTPNGSSVAGICDPTGRIMGMMPHPERRVEKIHGNADGLLIFQSGVAAVS